MHYVVGSGPAGVACASALVRNGAAVTMLDVGLDLEPEREERLRRVRAAGDPTADGEARAVLEGMKAETLATMDGDGVPTKLRYGSDFPYRDTEAALGVVRDGVGGSASLAKGGLSRVWGGQVLPYRDADLAEWPLDAADLAPYYRAAFDLLDVAAERDDLAEVFPLYADDPRHVSRSRAAERLVERWRARDADLERAGIRFGYSRLAMDAGADGPCPHCGLKVFGCCPRGSVYDAVDTVERLREADGFRYEPDHLVETVAEDGATATVAGRRYGDGTRFSYEGEKVFLACGAVSTTKILLASLSLHNEPVVLRESPCFVLPLVDLTGTSGGERTNTLSELFVELTGGRVSDRTVHLQLYTANELYEAAVGARLGPLGRLVGPLAGRLLRRTVVAIGYLHSGHGAGIDVRLAEGGDLELSGGPRDGARGDARAVGRRLLRDARRLGLVPLMPLLELLPPGESYHVGGTFPMRERPAGAETDLLGRPVGFDRVHAVDSTVFPTVPATTITASIMAMAYRIGDSHDGDPC